MTLSTTPLRKGSSAHTRRQKDNLSELEDGQAIPEKHEGCPGRAHSNLCMVNSCMAPKARTQPAVALESEYTGLQLYGRAAFPTRASLSGCCGKRSMQLKTK